MLLPVGGEMSSKRARRDARNDPRLVEAARLLGELADEQCGPDATFAERSAAAARVVQAMLDGPPDIGGTDNDDERENP